NKIECARIDTAAQIFARRVDLIQKVDHLPESGSLDVAAQCAGGSPWQLLGTLGRLNFARLPQVSQPPSALRSANSPKMPKILRFKVEVSRVR
ncbi:MAG: hypothetical protein ACLP8A_09540, partial [Methylovirgula sp.]